MLNNYLNSITEEVRPVIIMVSVEPVSFKRVDKLPFIFQQMNHCKSFLTLIVFYLPKRKLYEITLMLHPFEKSAPPVMLIEVFKNIKSKTVQNFLEYPLRLFNPFKRAILAFDDKSYPLSMFRPILDEWHKSLQLK